MKKFYGIFLLLLCCSMSAHGQATTSSVFGQVTDDKKEALPGTAIIAIHEPSGTQYGTTVNTQGKFQIQGMRPGGPYRIEFSYLGYAKAVFTGIVLNLGEVYTCDASLVPSTELEEVVVTGTSSKFAGEKTGATSHITSKDIQRFPNISRSLTDLTKMSPYMNGPGVGGRDVRLSNFTVDGANFNNATGLDGAALPGGGNPISIDAIEEIQVSVAPFDVRQSNFIGGAVSAVTKSGTNHFKASAYMYLKNEHLRGNEVDGVDLGERPAERRNVYGFTLGGPIVRNKLFFFVNGEREYSPFPIIKWKLSEDGKFDNQNLISRVTDADMSRFSKDLKEMYGYDTGSWSDFSGKAEVYRAVARLDWNISDRHRFMLRYNYTGQQRDNAPVAAPVAPNQSPYGNYSMTFRNSTWQLLDNVHSFTAELHSRFGASVNNQLLASLNLNDVNNRECNGDFPGVDIMANDETGTARPFLNAGYDPHSWRNGVKETLWSLTDNLSIQLGSHNLMLGASFESQNISNCYMRFGAGYYRYASYDDFVNRRAPVAFALSYSLTGEAKALAEVHYAQFSLYAQDEFNASERLKLFYGIRMDLPMYLNDRYENPSITSYEFNGTKLSTALWPKVRALFSPRIGFNYDLSGDKTLKLRGGTGIFTGRFPLIFLSKMQEGSGMLTATVSINQANDPVLAALAGKGILTPNEVLEQIAPQFPDRFPAKPGAVNNIVTIDRDFKLPQVWKSSLAVDWRMPLPFFSMLTLEGIYIKDINAIVQRNLNVIDENDAEMSRLSGPDDRYYYPGNTGMRIHEKINYAMLMTNTSKGYSYSVNATLNMEPARGLNLMAAYTYTGSKTLTNNKSNQIDQIWSQEPSVNGPNNLSMHNASYLFTPHRIIAAVSYTVDYAKFLSTGISLFYTGERAGSYTYVIDGDINNDGYNTVDLMYIPASRDALNFVDMKVGERTFTAAEQSDAFWDFVDQDPYLSTRRGKYTETNGAFLPWYHRVDLRITQDFRIRTRKSTHTLQLSVDILNLGNLLNSSWGLIRGVTTVSPLKFKGLNADNEPTYTMNTINEDGVAVLPYRSFVPNRNSNNCWQLQFGIRYIFN